jgi:Spy/CpxP family protein refolding chaperone
MKARSTLITALLAGALVLWFTAGPVLAQNPPQRRNVRKDILTLMLLRMTQVLELNEEQTAQLYPLITRLEREKMAINQETVKLMRDLRYLLQKERTDEQEIARVIDRIKELRAEIRAKDGEVEAVIEERLTLEQQAKFLIFFQDFNQYLRDKILEARQKANPPRKKLPNRQF